MHRNLIKAAVFSCGTFLLGTIWQTRATEAEPAANHPTKVAILDMAKVFEAHPGLKRASEALAVDLKAAERILAEKKKAVEDAQRSLDASEDSPAKKAEAAAHISEQKSQIEKFLSQQRPEFIEREAKT